MHRHDHKEREPKAFPQYDDAAHIDSAAVAAVGADTRAQRRSQSNGLHGEILRGAAQITNGGGCRADYLKWQGYNFLQTKTAERYKSFRRLA